VKADTEWATESVSQVVTILQNTLPVLMLVNYYSRNVAVSSYTSLPKSSSEIVPHKTSLQGIMMS
jgi:hypothetical protein